MKYHIEMRIIISKDKESELLEELKQFTYKVYNNIDKNINRQTLKYYLHLYLTDALRKDLIFNFLDSFENESHIGDLIDYKFLSNFNADEERLNTIKEFLKIFKNYVYTGSSVILLNITDELLVFEYSVFDFLTKNDSIMYSFSSDKYNLRICRNCGKVLSKSAYIIATAFSKNNKSSIHCYIRPFDFNYTKSNLQKYAQCIHCNRLTFKVDLPLLKLITNLFNLGFEIADCNYYTDHDFESKYNYKEKDVYIDFDNNQNYRIEDIKKILEDNIDGTDWDLRYNNYYLRLYYPGLKSNIENVNILNDRIEKLLTEKKKGELI